VIKYTIFLHGLAQQ